MLVGGSDSKKRSTPSKKKPCSENSGDEDDGPPKSQPKRPRTVPPSIRSTPKWVRPRARRLPRRRSRLRCAVITACVSVSICFRLDWHTVARPVLHRCETGALFHVLVILGAAVPKFINSPFFYPCCAISFEGIVALIYYCIGCTGGASIACWLVVHCFSRFAYNRNDWVSSSFNKKQTRVFHVLACHHPCFMF